MNGVAEAVLTVQAVPVRPPLKWAGGKRWLVPHLSELWGSFQNRRLIEPFCGGLAVTVGLRPDRALLNDVNPHLMNFYRWLKAGFRIRSPMENSAAAFYRARSRFNALLAAGAGQTVAASIFAASLGTRYHATARRAVLRWPGRNGRTQARSGTTE